VIIPAPVLVFAISGGWLISLIFAFVGGARGRTEERLTHPAILTGSVISLGGTLVATLQVSVLPAVSGWGDIGVWVAGLIVATAASATPFAAYSCGVSAARRKEKEDASHRQSMTEMQRHHASLNRLSV
jgi:hypothetical protein